MIELKCISNAALRVRARALRCQFRQLPLAGNSSHTAPSLRRLVNFRRICELACVPAPLPSTAFADIV
jgi:hypothetical protein